MRVDSKAAKLAGHGGAVRTSGMSASAGSEICSLIRCRQGCHRQGHEEADGRRAKPFGQPTAARGNRVLSCRVTGLLMQDLDEIALADDAELLKHGAKRPTTGSLTL